MLSHNLSGLPTTPIEQGHTASLQTSLGFLPSKFVLAVCHIASIPDHCQQFPIKILQSLGSISSQYFLWFYIIQSTTLSLPTIDSHQMSSKKDRLYVALYVRRGVPVMPGKEDTCV